MDGQPVGPVEGVVWTAVILLLVGPVFIVSMFDGDYRTLSEGPIWARALFWSFVVLPILVSALIIYVRIRGAWRDPDGPD